MATSNLDINDQEASLSDSLDALLSDYAGTAETYNQFDVCEDTEAELAENLLTHCTQSRGISENRDIADETENVPSDHSAQRPQSCRKMKTPTTCRPLGVIDGDGEVITSKRCVNC